MYSISIACFQSSGNGRIVDILGSESEMNPFPGFRIFGHFQFRFQKIFNSFYIVVGCLFNFLYFPGILHTEIFSNGFQLFAGVRRRS